MIQEFDIDIYSRKLWIATSWEDVKDKFTTYGGYEFEKSKDAYATTYPRMIRKATGKCGVLIVFYDCDKLCGINIIGNIARESRHAVKAIFNDIGFEYNSLMHDDQADYMEWWVNMCCRKVLQKEIYK